MAICIWSGFTGYRQEKALRKTAASPCRAPRSDESCVIAREQSDRGDLLLEKEPDSKTESGLRGKKAGVAMTRVSVFASVAWRSAFGVDSLDITKKKLYGRLPRRPAGLLAVTNHASSTFAPCLGWRGVGSCEDQNGKFLAEKGGVS